MLTVIIFGVISTVLVVYLHLQTNKKRLEKQKFGLEKVTKLKALIVHTQQHRGMSSAYLNGDQSAKPKLIAMENAIRGIINILDDTDIEKLNSRWVSFTDHWSRLIVSTHKSPLYSFKQHTVIIANLLYLLEDEAERSHLDSVYVPALPTIGLVWRELLSTAENVGQARAIGTGVATAKLCNNVDKIRLSFLVEQIEQTSQIILNQIQCLPDHSSEHNQLVNAAVEKTSNLIDVIKNELVYADEIQVVHTDYFNLASDTIKALNAIFDHQVVQVEQVL